MRKQGLCGALAALVLAAALTAGSAAYAAPPAAERTEAWTESTARSGTADGYAAQSAAQTENAAQSAGVRVAVIDSGISTAAVSAERIAAGDNYIRPQDGTEDRLGHGTAVAAIIAGSERARITGICPTAALVPLVYCSADADGREVSGGTAMTAQAVYDAVDVYGCRVINISSGTTTDSKTLRDAVDYAASRGALVVASAGNAGAADPDAVYYPGGYGSVLCVGACNADGSVADFSQRGETVDLLARGADLRLAGVDGTRIRGEGTSFAAAVVSGTAAQLWTLHPEWTADEVRAALLRTAQTVGGWPVLDPQRTLAVCTAVFSDVSGDAWYAEAVRWAAEHGIAQSGTGRFAPGAPCTRAEMVTFLYRAAGCPKAARTESGFADVPAGGTLERAVCWAVENGVTNGTDAGHFSPDAPCTRAQAAAFLHRALGLPEGRGDAAFSDVREGAWYAEAVRWAVGAGVTGGVGDGRFAPEEDCTRAQIVTFLRRAYNG